MADHSTLEPALNDFDGAVRLRALRELAAADLPPPPLRDAVNMHIHTFFSFNAEGWSPARAAWEMHQRGVFAAGIIDFDVLDGMEEFYTCGELLGLRTSVGVETRVFYTEYANREIDSPGEPGIHYVGGAGFTNLFARNTPQAEGLAFYRHAAQTRNRALIVRINSHVPEIALNYESDVLPRSPGHCPTERHIIAAYIDKSLAVFGDSQRAAFWAKLLGMPAEAIPALQANRAAMEDKVRAKLAKRGGLGYEQPTSRSFPLMEDFFAWVKSCGAIPMESWLDGTSEGEADAAPLLELSVAKGARALNIIPDRNWNLSDPALKTVKVNCLRRIVGLAETMDLPVIIGTEMNRAGLPAVDDLNGPVLREFKQTFLKGASILVGHTVCSRFAGYSYVGARAEDSFKNRSERNAFFAAVGRLPPVTCALSRRLREAGPERALEAIGNAAKAGRWSAD